MERTNNIATILGHIQGNLNPNALSFYKDGTHGNIRIDTFDKEVDMDIAEVLAMVQDMFYNNGAFSTRHVPIGTYRRLFVDNQVMMSNTPDEMNDALPFLHAARGRVLITGFGLGCTALACMLKTDVDSVTVVERNPYILQYVVPQFRAATKGLGSLNIIEGDAFERLTELPMSFDVAWHDIWPTITDLNYPEMEQLKSTHAYSMVPDTSEVFCWCESQCREMYITLEALKKRCIEEKGSLPPGWED